VPTVRLQLLVNYRPEYHHGWGNKTYYTQIRLDPLPAQTSGELLDAQLGTDDSLRPLKTLLGEKAAGNPLFIEEILRTLIDTKVLVGERAAYRLVQPIETVQVPATVHTILASRIDRLPPKEKRLLETAAVIGKDFPFALLRVVAGKSDEILRLELDHLQSAEFLYETSFSPDLAFTFKHALTHEVAYGSLLNENRRALHRQIMGAIETMYPGRQAEHVEQLGNHAFRGEAWEQAVTYLREAGMKALSRSANKDAAAHFERALTASKRVDHPDAKRQAADLSLAISSALFALGRITEVLGRLREAEPIAQDLGDQRILGTVYSFLGECLWLTGQNVLAAEYGQRGLEIAVALQSLPLQVGGNFILGHAYHARGDYTRALEHLGENVRLLQGELVYKRMGQSGLASVLSRTWIAWSHAELGSFAEGCAQAEEAVRIAERANHPFSIVSAHLATGIVWLQKGEERRR
jgi:tetratricopeptide (TPR) repeat protein